MVRCTQVIWPTQDALQSLETLERHGDVRQSFRRIGCRCGGAADDDDDDDHDSCDLPQSAMHSFEPTAKRGCSRLIGRTKGGMNTKLHSVTDAMGRPFKFLMCASQVSDLAGAAVLLSSLPKADWPLADRGYDAD